MMKRILLVILTISNVFLINSQNKFNTEKNIIPGLSREKNQLDQLKTHPESVEYIIKSTSKGVISDFPYEQFFESLDGWTITDESTTSSFNMQINALRGLDALSGKTYLISGYDHTTLKRNAIASSPAMSLQADKKYKIYMYVRALGYSVPDEFTLTVKSLSSDDSNLTLIDKTGTNAVKYTNWTLLETSFTPKVDGNYYFLINHCTLGAGNAVAFENFIVSEGDYVAPTEGEIYQAGGLWSISNEIPTTYVAEGEEIIYFSKFRNVKESSWSFDNNAFDTTHIKKNEEIAVIYSTFGSHIASLELKGLPGNDKTVKIDKTIYIQRPHGINDGIWNIAPNEILTTYEAYGDNQYWYGVNNIHKKVAEYYPLPADLSVDLETISFYTGYYKLEDTNHNAEFPIIIYAENATTGLPDSIIAEYKPLYKDVFGTTDLENKLITFELEKPLKIEGSFFIAVDFSKGGTANSTNYLGLVSTVERKYNYGTAYLFMNNRWTKENLFSIGIAPQLIFDNPVTSAKTFIPAADAINIMPETDLFVLFNREIEVTDLEEIKITYGEDNIEFSDINTTKEGYVLSIKHTDFEYNTKYTVTIPADLLGNEKDISWSFTTIAEELIPLFQSVSPEDGSENVKIEAEISINFDKAITLVEKNNIITITNEEDKTIETVKGSVSEKKLKITTHKPFAYETTYTVNIPAYAVKYYNKDISWSFTTMEEPGVSIGKLNEENIILYPNPTKGVLNITVPETAVVKIRDISGKIFESHIMKNRLILELNYSNGLYIIQIEDNNGISNYKVLLHK